MSVNMQNNDADYVIARQGGTNNQLTAGMSAMFANIVPLVLFQLAGQVESKMPSCVIYDEPIYVSGKLSRVMSRFWPVLSIQKATLNGVSPMRTGKPLDVYTGKADIAIVEGGKYLQLANACEDSTIFLTYSAGYDSLPPDLLEVFFEWTMLVTKELDRIGQKDAKIETRCRWRASRGYCRTGACER